MRKTILSLSILLLFIPAAISAEFWASKKSNKYHYPTCIWAQKIKPANLIKFASPEEAVKTGYVPCKVCNPPLPSKTGMNEPAQRFYAQTGQKDDVEKRGCCSWHGGVCGCSNGRALCCDGTLSPSCGCD
jgi:hypothetical protein